MPGCVCVCVFVCVCECVCVCEVCVCVREGRTWRGPRIRDLKLGTARGLLQKKGHEGGRA